MWMGDNDFVPAVRVIQIIRDTLGDEGVNKGSHKHFFAFFKLSFDCFWKTLSF